MYKLAIKLAYALIYSGSRSERLSRRLWRRGRPGFRSIPGRAPPSGPLLATH
jgi:hypothetical protein